jgi:hypothetical protein
MPPDLNIFTSNRARLTIQRTICRLEDNYLKKRLAGFNDLFAQPKESRGSREL